ncbi:MAG: LLM class F420-dependent oxidoreductase [Acidimicrobiales bacterium]
MQLGVVFPQLDLGGDVGAVRHYATAVADLGFEHLAIYDHVVGADPTVHRGWSGPYDLHSTFHEPFVLFGFLAAITDMELVTSIVILPQRQTVLVAKQAAEVDLLTSGRFRLGVGVGWNAVEYEALDQDFATRGRREEEQIHLLRRLWTEPSITFTGEFDTLTGAGIAPLPVQRPIPVWLGGASEPAYRRIGRLGDGWFPQVPPGDRLDQALAVIAAEADRVGRDPGSIEMEGRVSWGPDGVETILDHAERWRRAGASHLSINTMGAGFTTVDQHVEALAASIEALRT